MEDLISIIVPIYNVELYLDDCIKTIINQTYKNIEIILVDDGSTDNSAKICDEYEKKDSRIKVIHKENGGLSDARNKGLEEAKGKYICFIDSDDLISYKFIEILYKQCIDNNSEIAICQLQIVKDNENKKINVEDTKNINVQNMTGRKLSIFIYNGEYKDISFSACNKLYRRDLFINNNIKYPYGKYYEDTQTTFKLFYKANNITINNEFLYYYRKREESITTSKVSRKKFIDGIDADLIPVEFYEKENDSILLSLSFNVFCKNLIKMFINLNDLKEKDKKCCKEYLINKYILVWKKYHKKIKLKIKNKLVFFIFYMFIKNK